MQIFSIPCHSDPLELLVLQPAGTGARLGFQVISRTGTTIHYREYLDQDRIRLLANYLRRLSEPCEPLQLVRRHSTSIQCTASGNQLRPATFLFRSDLPPQGLTAIESVRISARDLPALLSYLDAISG